MLEPIYLENKKLLIHTFRPEDLGRFQELTGDIFEILSDQWTLKFIPEKRLNNLQEAELFLQTAIINYHLGHNFLHFISHKELNKVIGMINLISPEVAKEHYRMEHYPFFIEFYLISPASGSSIMTEILPSMVDEFLKQGITRIGAVVNRKNIAARKVLENANFNFKAPFDALQDLYEIEIN
jgi:RimJ/RimL family protein N-acetyltransferase